MTQNAWDFTAYTAAFAKGAPVTQPTPPPSSPPPSSPPPSSPPPSSPPPSPGSCGAAAWKSNQAYVSGDEVTYNGHEWTASQWNYDEVIGGPAGAWNDDGAC